MNEIHSLPLEPNLSRGPVWGHWNNTYVPDPITGLVAFPSFLKTFKCLFGELLYTFDGVGLAIGDVDHLKTYVESIRNKDPLMFGHLAGNAFMSKLGAIGLGAFEQMSFPWRCLATFGGDEIILAGAGCSRAAFVTSVQSLSEKLAAGLPRTVSFAHGWFALSREQRCSRISDAAAASLSVSVIAMVDRALFSCKAQRDKLGSSQPPVITMMKTRWLRGDQWTLSEAHDELSTTSEG